jgi:hypothetical protein
MHYLKDHMHKYKLTYLLCAFPFNEITEFGTFSNVVYGGAQDKYATLEEAQLLIHIVSG